MIKRSLLAIVMEQLERMHRQSGRRFCFLSHGPEPVNGNDWKFKDGSVYNIKVLAWILPQMELQYTQETYSAISYHYKQWAEDYKKLMGEL